MVSTSRYSIFNSAECHGGAPGRHWKGKGLQGLLKVNLPVIVPCQHSQQNLHAQQTDLHLLTHLSAILSCSLFGVITTPAQPCYAVHALVEGFRQGVCASHMVADKQCDHMFGDAHQQMHLHFIVGKPLARALPRSSTEGMKVARLVGVLTQPPTKHSHICCGWFWYAEVVTKRNTHCSLCMQMWSADMSAQTDSTDRQHLHTAQTDCPK